jgi:hypothetical protein
MGTLSALITRGRRSGLAGRRAWVLAVPLLAAGALAAGCGQPSYGYPGGVASGYSSLPVTTTATPAAPAPPAATVSSDPVAAPGIDCPDWPVSLPAVALPASFVPVSVERCVNGTETIPGHGLYTTATVERSTSDLSRLVNALRQPNAGPTPGTVCPAIAVIPPQIVLTDAAGEKVVPRLPAGECGLPATAVLAALNQLRWQVVSVRLLALVSSAPTTAGVGGG